MHTRGVVSGLHGVMVIRHLPEGRPVFAVMTNFEIGSRPVCMEREGILTLRDEI